MQWNPEILDRYLAPGFSQFTNAAIPDLTDAFPQATHWLTNHFLNNALRTSFKSKWRQVVLAYLRRSSNAFAAYHDARRLTLAYLDGVDPLNPHVRSYFAAVSAWEGYVLQVSMAIQLFKWLNLGQEAFVKNDGSKEQRLYDMANSVKHTASAVDSGHCTDQDTIPLWLTNSGLCTFGMAVTYTETAEVLADIARLADEYQDAHSFRLAALALRDAENEGANAI